MYDKPIINLFGGKFQVNLYGICFAVGIVVCLLVFMFYTKKKNMDPKAQNFFYFTAIGAIVVGYLFAALFQAVYDYIEDPSKGFKFGGITFLGGLIGGVGGFLAIYFIFGRKKYKDSFPRLLQVAPCCILIAHAFGRIGCFFAGCCYGKETDSFLGVKFPGLPNPVHPTQLYEAAFLFLLFAFFTYLVMKKKDQHNLGLYFVLYGVFRFAIEFLRGDDRGKFIGVLSPSQFWSIVMILIGLFLIFALPRIMRAVEEKKKADQ